MESGHVRGGSKEVVRRLPESVLLPWLQIVEQNHCGQGHRRRYAVNFHHLIITSFSSFLLSFLPSFLPSSLPSFLPSFLPSSLPSFLPSFLSFMKMYDYRFHEYKYNMYDYSFHEYEYSKMSSIVLLDHQMMKGTEICEPYEVGTDWNVANFDRDHGVPAGMDGSSWWSFVRVLLGLVLSSSLSTWLPIHASTLLGSYYLWAYIRLKEIVCSHLVHSSWFWGSA